MSQDEYLTVRSAQETERFSDLTIQTAKLFCGRSDFETCGFHFRKVFDTRRSLFTVAPLPIVTGIGDDAKQPRTKARLRLKFSQAVKRTQKSILTSFLGVFAISEVALTGA